MNDSLNTLLDIYARVVKQERGDVDASVNVEEIPSIDRLELLFEIEDAFDIRVPYEELSDTERPKTLGDFATYVEGLIAEARS